MAQDPAYGRRQFLKESVLSLARTAHEYVKHPHGIGKFR